MLILNIICYISFVFFSLLILAGYQPESEWDRAQSESLMITANDLSQTISTNIYIYTVYKVSFRIN